MFPIAIAAIVGVVIGCYTVLAIGKSLSDYEDPSGWEVPTMKHVTYVPDCPECGREMVQSKGYVEGTQTEENPFGEAEYWWTCPSCGWTSEVASSWGDFDALTDYLTVPLKEAPDGR